MVNSEKNNYTFNVFEKINPENRINWKLYIDAIYKASPTANLSSEVLSKLLGVKNQGGFRYLGKTECPNLVILFTSGEDIYWRDELDSSMGLLLYYGDNKTPGTDLHKTNLHGNQILKYIFDLACSDDIEKRRKIPPIFVFKKASGRDVKFLGLAVPGIKGKPQKDWLTAVWGCNKFGDRFQNYKSYFTILNTSSGSEYEDGFGINLAWLNDIEKGNACESIFAPKEWLKFINKKNYSSLVSRVEKTARSKEEQLPNTKEKMKMLKELHDFFIEKDNGYSFELFAADFTKYMDNAVIDVSVTQPYKDGGIDGEGKYKIFNNAENVIYVDFYIQAKCYSPDHAVGVKDTSRLISRIKNRQFGIMFTTSYVHKQAYSELLEDGHPVVLITGKNIIDFIYNDLEVRDIQAFRNWLILNYGDVEKRR